jgi:exopolysaccharide biosynthesis polyprenyl glycosylphosphotransferase
MRPGVTDAYREGSTVEHRLVEVSSNGAAALNGQVTVDGDVAERVRVAVPGVRRSITFRYWAVVLDLAMLGAANLLFLASDPVLSFQPSLLLAFDAVVVGLMFAWRGYAPRLRLDALYDIRLALSSVAIATMAALLLGALVAAAQPSAYAALQLWLLASGTLALGRVTSNGASTWRRRSGRRAAQTLIVGAGHVGQLAARRLVEHTELGLQPVGFLDSEPLDIEGKPLPLPVLGTSSDLEQVVAARDVQCVVVSFSGDSHDDTLALLDECHRLGVRALVVPRLFERVPSRLEVTHVGGLPLLQMLPTSPRSLQFAVKYALDRVLAALALVILSPLLALIGIAVAVSLGRPILYRQHRVGLDGRHFRMLKFRTMRATSDEDENENAQEFHPDFAPGGVEGVDRRTRVGAFLRRWSLDELAQLINVAMGEMSLVGPRPERPEYDEYFREHVRRYDGRLRTKGGITGWAQIHRLRGQTSISDRVEWDNYYIENFSLWLDLKILLRTIPAALKGDAS